MSYDNHEANVRRHAKRAGSEPRDTGTETLYFRNLGMRFGSI